ncbi:hypothetical protein AVEN_137804-1 [Araneus ventricosus]|uniref:Uncharacterized protein n=1 Tax=Araneus ventricosus TaxID=182803 RepID=A0A4Y2F4M4_ARAVE|nr:hypothetical protein AVEN_137804-1 [Araneus ventricosus]
MDIPLPKYWHVSSLCQVPKCPPLTLSYHFVVRKINTWTSHCQNTDASSLCHQEVWCCLTLSLTTSDCPEDQHMDVSLLKIYYQTWAIPSYLFSWKSTLQLLCQ